MPSARALASDVSGAIWSAGTASDGLSDAALAKALAKSPTDGNLSVEDWTFYLQLTAPNGATVVVESSSELKTWAPCQTNTLPYGELDLEMPMGTNAQQFFRARIQ